MKFGQDFELALARGEYPPEWVHSAISYKELKKCIKRVQQELLSLGLDKDTLDALWNRTGGEVEHTEEANADSAFHYAIDGETVSFTPKLTLLIDPRTGSPIDAWLSPDTRKILRRLARSSQAENRELSPERERSPTASPNLPGQQVQLVEVPLTADSEFFQTLRQELACLDDLQKAEYARLQDEINQLGSELRILQAKKSKRSKKEIDTWRRIFELYADAEVFLSSHEADAGARDASHAQKHLQSFTQSLTTQQKTPDFKLGHEANTALFRFLRINVKLLRLIKFQEINRTALNKIMKKFDKRTALHATSSVSRSLTNSSPFMVQDLARATSFTISTEVLSIIPQLNDYLCPICFSISWRPVRLRCNHLFCIRCMIVLQREEKTKCPLCRDEVVMEATERNIDGETVEFMKKNFKADVKAKQKQNEIAAGIDRWGAAYEQVQGQKCVVM